MFGYLIVADGLVVGCAGLDIIADCCNSVVVSVCRFGLLYCVCLELIWFVVVCFVSV